MEDKDIITRVDFYYADGKCKTAIGQEAKNFQNNFNIAVVEVIGGGELKTVKFTERKMLDENEITGLAIKYSQSIAATGDMHNPVNRMDLIHDAITVVLREQKIASLKDLITDCKSNGYQLLFDLAAMVDNNEAKELIKQAAQLLLK